MTSSRTSSSTDGLDIPQPSLHEFVRQAWHVLEPAHPFVDNWHIAAICEHLEAVSRGEIQNLLINIPPRHMKSLLVSVFWPCWEFRRGACDWRLRVGYPRLVHAATKRG